MTHKPDDNDIIHFLKQNRPIPPPAAPDLEDQLIAQLTPSRRNRHLWIVPSAIAASLITAFVSYRAIDLINTHNQAEAAKLEAFMESSWSSTLSNQGESVSSTDGETLALNDLYSDQ